MEMESTNSSCPRAPSDMPDHSFFSRLRTGLALPSLTVAFTPARAVTSHLRRRYHERYKSRYRFPGLLFAIDVSIILVVIGIVSTAIWFSLWQPLPDSGLRLVFSAPPITTATTIALEADVSVQDQSTHSDVRLRWVLPSGTEVVSASPPIDTRREAILGDIKPGEKRVARLAARIMAPPGSVRIGFQLRSGDELVSGEEVRPIIGSALHLEPILKNVRAALPGYDIYTLTNQGNSSIDCAQLQVDSSFSERLDALTIEQSGRGGRAIFGPIGPHEQRLIEIERAPGTIRVLCRGIELERVQVASVALPTNTEGIKLDMTPSTPGPGQETVVLVNAAEPLRVLVRHPLLEDAENGLRWFDISSGTTRLVLPLDNGKQLPASSDNGPTWMAWLVRQTPAGPELLSFARDAITTPFALVAEARYYAASGGQIGAGPLPPQVGKTTRYWVQWKLAPTKSDISSFVVKASLPPGVRWTGQTALPNGGTFEEKNGELIWSIPFLPARLEPTSAAFEIALTPTADMKGRTAVILNTAAAQAIENRSSSALTSKANLLDTSLPSDEQARGKGSVR